MHCTARCRQDTRLALPLLYRFRLLCCFLQGKSMAQEDTKEAVWRGLVELLTCCWHQTEYETPPEQPSRPPVQTLAESLIPTGGAAGLSATPSVDEEATLLPARNQPGQCHARQYVVRLLLHLRNESSGCRQQRSCHTARLPDLTGLSSAKGMLLCYRVLVLMHP